MYDKSYNTQISRLVGREVANRLYQADL